METYSLIWAAVSMIVLGALFFSLSSGWCFYCMILTVAVGPVGSFGVAGKSAPILLLDIAAFVWAAVWLIRRDGSDWPQAATVPARFLIAFVVIAALITAAKSPDLLKAGYALKTYVVGAIGFLAGVRSIRTRRDLERAALAFAVLGCIVAGEVLLLTDSGGSDLWTMFINQKNSARSTFGQSNYVAGLLVILLPFAFTLLGHSRPRRIFGLLCASAMVVGIIATDSRGGILSLVGGLLLISFFKPKVLLRLGVIALAVGIAAFAIVPDAFWTHMDSQFHLVATDSNSLVRVQMWRSAAEIFAANPVIGIGVKASGFEFMNTVGITEHVDAHNLFLTLLAETGIIGAVAYLAPAWICLRRTWRAARAVRTIRAMAGATSFELAGLGRTAKEVEPFAIAIVMSFVIGLLHSMVEILHGGAEFTFLFWGIAALGLRTDLLTPRMVSKGATAPLTAQSAPAFN